MAASAFAQDAVRFVQTVDNAIVCENSSAAPVDFNHPDCEHLALSNIDPQGTVVWLKTTFQLPDQLTASEVPLTLHIGALSSSEVYWNGKLLGRNGVVGSSRTSEKPGLLDAAWFVPRHLMAAGDNDITIKMASFHNLIHVHTPVHYIYVAAARPASSPLTIYYMPALLTASAFVLAAVYFGFISLTDKRRVGTILIALMALFAAVQLGAESLRSLIDYAYPWQIWRLMVVVFCAAGFGICMTAYIARRFQTRWRWFVGAAVIGAAFSILQIDGFDGKSAFSLFAANVAALLAVLLPAVRGVKNARMTALALAGFMALIIWDGQSFLDRTFFVAAAVMIVALFIDQAREMRRIQLDREAVQVRAEQLELELLRRRIAPHFLMNTLNALTEWVESEPATGVKMIDALAEEFRLLGQMSHRELVPLADEIVLCRRHLEVMSYRVDKAFSLVTEGVNEKLLVPPGIIHTLIENAFTHGRFADGAEFVLSLSKADGRAELVLITPAVDAVRSPDKSAGGEGLDYVRKRLAAAFGESASFADGPGANGGWVTRIGFRDCDIECSDR